MKVIELELGVGLKAHEVSSTTVFEIAFTAFLDEKRSNSLNIISIFPLISFSNNN